MTHGMRIDGPSLDLPSLLLGTFLAFVFTTIGCVAVWVGMASVLMALFVGRPSIIGVAILTTMISFSIAWALFTGMLSVWWCAALLSSAIAACICWVELPFGPEQGVSREFQSAGLVLLSIVVLNVMIRIGRRFSGRQPL